MITIYDDNDMRRVLSGPIDPALKNILLDRIALFAEYADFNLSDLANFFIVEPGDSIAAIESELGCPIFVNRVDSVRYPSRAFTPNWENLVARGTWYDFVFALCDSGLGHVLLVPESDGVEPTLLELCRAYSGI